MTEPIMGVEFAHPRIPGLGLEALSLSDLRRRAPPDHFQRPQRPAFHMLLLVDAGRGWHSLDFRLIDCNPGTIIHVRPGQLQRFDMRGGLDGQVILFRPDFPLVEAPAPEMPLAERAVPEGTANLEGMDLLAATEGFDMVARGHARGDGSVVGTMILQHLLQALLLRLSTRPDAAALPPLTGGRHVTLFRMFRQVLEARFAAGWGVADYARALAMSEKTLTRVCVRVGGAAPGRIAEARLLLEAKRLLAHSDLSGVAIGSELGFDDPSNFTKFFRRLTGVTPMAFRRRQRGSA